MKSYYILFLSVILSFMIQPVDAQSQYKEKADIVRKTALHYWLKLPVGYKKEKGKTFPLLIFLHGSGERGDSLELVKKHGPPSFVDDRPDFPFIVVSPQCPKGTWWITEDLQAMLEQILTKYRVDTTRIYLTGLSMGGFGTWAWACKYPDQFAAIAPVCGGGDIQFAGALKNMPIWAFHGEADPVVPVKRTVEMVEAVNSNGGNARMTIYPGVGHDSWENAYADDELYKWMLTQVKHAH
ncbi:MAG: prolyl oligopeptidase family serine peptidase [Bacteroidota bacterium]